MFARDAIGLDHKIWKGKGYRGSGSPCIDIEELYEVLETDRCTTGY